MTDNPYRAVESDVPGTIGWRIHYYSEVLSTQTVAAEMAQAGAAHGTTVIAETQSGGKGRAGRSWHSPPGVNLYLTVILRPGPQTGPLGRIGVAAGVAAAEALERVAAGIIALKWPNDVWLNGKKAGGILAEAWADARRESFVVLLGIGLNLNLSHADLPAELQGRATSVLIETGRRCDRIEVARALLYRLQSRYMETVGGRFDLVRRAWEGYSALTGRTVTVVAGSERETGIARGIDADGALLLELDGATVRIMAGDVSVEGAYT